MKKNKNNESLRERSKPLFWIIRSIPARINNTLFYAKNKTYPNEVFLSENKGLHLWGHLKFKQLLDTKTQQIKIPKKIKQIKIDVGTAMNAPNSELWLNNLSDRVVFGFEPNPKSVRELLSGDNKKYGNSYRYLNLKHVDNRFFLFNVAIDDCSLQLKPFYLTKGDGGNSSLHKPSEFKIKDRIFVPCIRLSDFLSLIPWKRFRYIEHLKIDTQGNDLRVLKSAGDYLQRIVFISVECTARGYEHTHTEEELDYFMGTEGFEIIPETDRGGNKTYINKKYKNLRGELDYSTENR